MSRLSDLTRSFQRRLVGYANCIARIEEQFALHRLKVTDVELVYSSTFLSVYTHWESLLEQTLFEAVCGPPSVKRVNKRIATFPSRRQLRELLLFPGKDYISISSLKQAEELLSLFVKNGRPLSVVNQQDHTLIQQTTWIRNAIAHAGDHALSTFRRKVPGVSALPARKRLPGSFLRHEFRQSPTQRRYELYFVTFRRAASTIGSAW